MGARRGASAPECWGSQRAMPFPTRPPRASSAASRGSPALGRPQQELRTVGAYTKVLFRAPTRWAPPHRWFLSSVRAEGVGDIRFGVASSPQPATGDEVGVTRQSDLRRRFDLARRPNLHTAIGLGVAGDAAPRWAGRRRAWPAPAAGPQASDEARNTGAALERLGRARTREHDSRSPLSVWGRGRSLTIGCW